MDKTENKTNPFILPRPTFLFCFKQRLFYFPYFFQETKTLNFYIQVVEAGDKKLHFYVRCFLLRKKD